MLAEALPVAREGHFAARVLLLGKLLLASRFFHKLLIARFVARVLLLANFLLARFLTAREDASLKSSCSQMLLLTRLAARKVAAHEDVCLKSCCSRKLLLIKTLRAKLLFAVLSV